MDERHWWIASKVQETFRIGASDNPSMLEDYMCREDNRKLITAFLEFEGTTQLYFCCGVERDTTYGLQIMNSTQDVRNFLRSSVGSVLFFLRLKSDGVMNIENEVLCGEIKENILENLTITLHEALLPILKRNSSSDHWSSSQKLSSLLSFEKHTNVLNEINKSSMMKTQIKILREPQHLVASESKLQRYGAYESEVQEEYEDLVAEWTDTIEAIIYDNSDARLLDPNVGPLAELERWQRRQRILLSLTEQLKGKECKTVIGALITSKSRLLKRWRQIDTSITEVVNETRDRVKYLEALRRHFDQMYEGSSPQQLLTLTLPAFFSAIKQMESVSRYYARTGYLGALFLKVANQLTQVCKAHIKDLCIPDGEEDSLHKVVEGDLKCLEARDFIEVTPRQYKVTMDTKTKSNRGLSGPASRPGGALGNTGASAGGTVANSLDTSSVLTDLGIDHATLSGRLRTCLLVLAQFRESFRAMRDGLGLGTGSGQAGSSQAPSSVASLSSFNIGMKRTLPDQAQTPITGNKAAVSSSSPLSGKVITASTVSMATGIAIYDEESILGPTTERLSNRLRYWLEMLGTINQMGGLAKSTVGIPLPRAEDLKEAAEEGGEAAWAALAAVVSGEGEEEQGDGVVELAVTQDDGDVPDPSRHRLDQAQLTAISEVSEEGAEKSGATTPPSRRESVKPAITKAYHPPAVKDEQDVINNYYTGAENDPPLSQVVRAFQTGLLQLITGQMTTVAMLDVESKEQDRFAGVRAQFAEKVREFEQLIVAYLHAVLMRPMHTHEALEILTKLQPVQNRSEIRPTWTEKMVDVFHEFETDLNDVKEVYDKFKNDPPRPRNSPPVAGAICWSRKLLSLLEEPMRQFQENKTITGLKEYPRIVRRYNNIATTLVAFESLYFTQWKHGIEACRAGIKAPLLVVNSQSDQLQVNADPRMFELLQETKWLARLGLDVPDPVRPLLELEPRVKLYYGRLTEVVSRFYMVIGRIPACLRLLFVRHVDKARLAFRPGLSALTWDSLNCDPFVHLLQTSVDQLERTVDEVNRILTEEVDAVLTQVASMHLIDFELAFSKLWTADKFINEMSTCMEAQYRLVAQLVLRVENGLRTVVNLLINKELSSVNRQKLYVKDQPPTSSNKLDPTEDDLLAGLLNHYFTQIYSSLLCTTCTTILTLATAAGCDPNEMAQTAFFPIFQQILSYGQAGRQASDESGIDSGRSGEMADGVQEGKELDNGGATEEQLMLAENVERCREKHQSMESRAGSSVGGSRGSPRHQGRRPLSVSDLTWALDNVEDRDLASPILRFAVQVKYAVPKLTIEPNLATVQNALLKVARAVGAACTSLTWLNDDPLGAACRQRIEEEDCLRELIAHISGVTDELSQSVTGYLRRFTVYDFLWRDNLKGGASEFLSQHPTVHNLRQEVGRLLRLERQITDIPDQLPVGCVVLETAPAKEVLRGLAVTWKETFGAALHEEAKTQLNAAVSYREAVRTRLVVEVTTLDELNQTLHLLEELADMENKVDGIYLPIETLYSQLDEFGLRLPRAETREVAELRRHWHDLVQTADDVRSLLLKEKKTAFEQELDKQVKSFVVEVIQFRNSFDAQGPAVPGIEPSEAVLRLQDFQQLFTKYDTKRRTLDSVSKLFGIRVKSFPELDRTGEELKLLGLLYGLFQKFIRFDQKLRATLWAEVDLDAVSKEVEMYWDECLALPSKLKDWDAFSDMKGRIQRYLEILPLLKRLSAREIRSRHWLQVMQTTGASFQLEANIFKLSDLMNIGLVEKRTEIEHICRAAQKELELELKMRQTEEEWTEQVLVFQPHKGRGFLLLDRNFTERLLEQLEDSQAMLAIMLTSQHIGPLKEEAAGWAEKLAEVAEVLELWLEAQQRWVHLEALFNVPETAKELPQEQKRFGRLDRSYVTMVKRSFETKNVLQCCYGGEVSKSVFLRHILEEFESCFKAVLQLLEQKRLAFPRLRFVTDTALLGILSQPNNLHSVRPHLRDLFSAVTDIRTEARSLFQVAEGTGNSTSGRTSRSQQRQSVGRGLLTSYSEPSSHGLGRVSAEKLSQDNMGVSLMHGDNTIQDEMLAHEVLALLSCDGEELNLDHKISLGGNVEMWLSEIQFDMEETLKRLAQQVISDINEGGLLEELAYKYPSQVCRLGLLFHWTRECESAINEIKTDRKALQAFCKRYNLVVSRVPATLQRGTWKSVEADMTPLHKVRLEILTQQALNLRDCTETLSYRKIRDLTDFDWRRNFRCYLTRSETDGKLSPSIYMMDTSLPLAYEFYGAQPLIAITPLTERCFVSMVTAIGQYRGCILQGPTGVGKSETIRGLAHLLGHHLAGVQCRVSDLSAQTIARTLQGVATDGCWAVLEDVQSCGKEALAVLFECARGIFQAMKAGLESCVLWESTAMSVQPTTAIFLTYNPSGTAEPLPKYLKHHFRGVALVRPDLLQILKTKCITLTYRAPSVLAVRLKIFADLVKDELPRELNHLFTLLPLQAALHRATQRRRLIKDDKQDERGGSVVGAAATISGVATLGPPPGGTRTAYGKKVSTPTPLSQAAKLEHGLVAKALYEILSPRLQPEYQTIVKGILRDTFYGIPDMPQALLPSSVVDLEAALGQAARDRGWTNHSPWIEKCVQINNVASVYQGIILFGPPSCGKSSALETLVTALSIVATAPPAASLPSDNARGSGVAGSERSNRLQRIYPLMLDDLDDLFGHMRSKESNEWVDGVFTASWRKANRNQSTTWFCLDGPLAPSTNSWVDNFTSVLDRSSSAFSRVLHLDRGDRLHFADNVKLVFETDTLAAASPAIVARAGIVHFAANTLSWRPMAQVWLEGRSPVEIHALTRAFDKTLDSTIQFLEDYERRYAVSTIATFQNCLSLLSAMLAENREVSGELHIERLYILCLVWTFGGFLTSTEQQALSDHLKTLTDALPDDDRNICVYDYYVDESGEWDPWASRVPELVNVDNLALFGDALVDTVDVVRNRSLLGFAHLAKRSVLLIGPRGAGKSVLINDFVNHQDEGELVSKMLVFSGATKARQLHTFLEANLHHRQGYVYGARDGHKLQLVIDDISLPLGSARGEDVELPSRVHELLRQLLDSHVLVTSQRPFEWRQVEDLTVVATMATGDDSPAVVQRTINPRLLRHFIPLHVPNPAGKVLRSVVRGIYEAHLSYNEEGQANMDIALLSNLTEAICRLLTAVRQVLRMSPGSGRQHYLFSLSEVNATAMAMRRLADESRAEEAHVVEFWAHEVKRIFCERLARSSDLFWFEEAFNKVVQETWPHLCPQLLTNKRQFITFANESRIYQRPITTKGVKQVRVTLHPVDSLDEVHDCLTAYMNRYNEELGHTELDITLSNNAIEHVVRVHRVLSYPVGGNMLLIGSVGSHQSNLCRLALHVADIPVHALDTGGKQSTFLDGLRNAVRQAGAEGKIIALLVTGRALDKEIVLDALNSILISGTYAHLFSNDEMDGLIQAILPSLRKEQHSATPTISPGNGTGTSTGTTAPAVVPAAPSVSGPIFNDPQRHFAARVRANLHLLFCLPPDHALVKRAIDRFPGILTRCQVSWVRDWPLDALLAEAEYFIGRHEDLGLAVPSPTTSPARLEAVSEDKILQQPTSNPDDVAGSTEKENDVTSRSTAVDSAPPAANNEANQDDRRRVATCLSQIHRWVIEECHQVSWAGSDAAEVKVMQVRLTDKKKDTMKTSETVVPNRPYSKLIIKELIRSRHRCMDRPAAREVSIGPLHYHRLLDVFRFLYSRKRSERARRVHLLRSCLVALDQSRHDAGVMRSAVRDIRDKYEEACATAALLLDQLTEKVTRLEKVRANLGEGSALNAFLKMHDVQDAPNVEEDSLLQLEQRDKFDEEFDRIREESLKNRQAQAKEDLEKAKDRYENTRKDLEYAREQVFYWKTKVDRQCVERIKAFQNPPILVGQVMEMIFVLIGKTLPGMVRLDRSNTTLAGVGAGAGGGAGMAPPLGDSVGSGGVGGGETFAAPGSRMSAGSGAVRGGRRPMGSGKDSQDRVDKSLWKHMQLSMSDAVKFVDMLQNISWEDGLDVDVLRAVESYLAKGKDGQLGITGEGSMLDNAENVTFKARRTTQAPPVGGQMLGTATAAGVGTGADTQSYGAGRGISIAAAKYSSEDAATLVQYAIALVEYSQRCSPLRQALNRMHELQREIEETERSRREAEAAKEMDEAAAREANAADTGDDLISEADVGALENEVSSLQTEYDRAITEKYKREMELRAMDERLRACIGITDSLYQMETQWRQFVEQNSSDDVLLANCIIAAAFLTYCGAMGTDERRRFTDRFIAFCQANHLLRTTRVLFRDFELANFLFTEVDVGSMSQLRLPTTRLQLENACFLMLENYCHAWPLLSDSTRWVVGWLQSYLANWPIVVVAYHELRSQLESCLSDGSILVVTDCDTQRLATDARIRQVLVNQSQFMEGGYPFKLVIGKQEVECQPRFRIFLHTSDPPSTVPAPLAAYTCLIRFDYSRRCIEDILLDRFVKLEKTRLETELLETVTEKLSSLRRLSALEEQMIECLSGAKRLMNDLTMTRKLEDLRKQQEETQESQIRVEISEDNVIKARDSYRIIARRGAVCFDAARFMATVNPLYGVSYDQFLTIFDGSVLHSDRTSMKAVLERLTNSCYQLTLRSILGQDRLIYSLLLSLEVCDSANLVGIGEREFIISPPLGAAVMCASRPKLEAAGGGGTAMAPKFPDPKFMQAKKPFDWMMDDQFANLQILAGHFEWFQEMFERMSKDGRETQWRTLVENEQPENAALPDKMDDTFSHVQRFCIIRAVRPDRLLQAARVFVSAVLGRKYVADPMPDMLIALRYTQPALPVLLLYQHEATAAERIFLQLAQRRQQETIILQMNDGTSQTERLVKRTLQKAITEGKWVLICSCIRSNTDLLLNVASFLAEQISATSERETGAGGGQTGLATFRCFLALRLSSSLPKYLLQVCMRMIVDSPRLVRDSLGRSLAIHLDPEVLRQWGGRSEWPGLVHNICLLHSLLQLRSRFQLAGFNVPGDVGGSVFEDELADAFRTMVQEMGDGLVTVLGSAPTAANSGTSAIEEKGANQGQPASALATVVPRTTSWQGLKYMLSEIIYGSLLTDHYDLQSVSAIVDFWITPNAVRKEFELTKVRYRIPPAFFNLTSRLPGILQAIEMLPPHQLEGPEACHLHTAAENVLGDDQYVFTRLNAIYDEMPVQDTLKHPLFRRPPTPVDGPIMSQVSPTSNHPLVVPLGLFASSSLVSNPATRKEIELWEVCHQLLSKLPKVYSRDSINDRLRKAGGLTAFNSFLLREMETLGRLVTRLRLSLSAIKMAVELDQLGDQLSPQNLDVADALINSRLPPPWLRLAGPTAPPSTYPIGSWVSELQMRAQHLEKILLLGRDKVPAYWLSAFVQPNSFLAIIKQEAYLQLGKSDRSGNIDPIVFHMEMTSRDKEHLREPPAEGVFLYGFYLWGCGWDKTGCELGDVPPKAAGIHLPVVHLTCVSSELAAPQQESARAQESYTCPVFHTHSGRGQETGEPIIELDLHHDSVPATRWALRGVHASLHPY